MKLDREPVEATSFLLNALDVTYAHVHFRVSHKVSVGTDAVIDAAYSIETFVVSKLIEYILK
jgi:hypothetical protein